MPQAKGHEKTLAATVQRIILKQALSYLPNALKTLDEIATSEVAADSARVAASRAIVSSLSVAAEGMTEDQAGQDLLKMIYAADHLSNIETEVPQGIKDSMDAT